MRFQPIVHIDDAVWRERLITDIISAPPASARLTIVSAPAGFGKTTVLAQLARRTQERGIKVAWMNCDSRDAHAEIFSENLLAALANCKLTTRPGANTLDHIAAYIASISEPVVIFIDEYETASSVAVDEIIEAIASVAPVQVSVVLASRETPHIQLTQLLLAGRVRLVDADLLRFSHDETLSLLRDVMPSSSVEHIEAYADGWPFALQLARLRGASGSADDWAFDAKVKMPRRQIFDYLAREVFSTLSQASIAFLTDVAVLENIDVAAANATRQHNNSLAFIQELSALKPIVVVDEGTWSARLHPLLKDYLIHEMEVAAPGKVQTLHLRAAEHFASQHCVYEAVYHAVAGSRLDLAARMIEDAGAIRLLLREGELRIRLLLQQLPAAALQQRPRLRLLQIGQRILEQNTSGLGVEFARVECLINDVERVADPTMQLDLELARCVVLINDAEHTLRFSPWETLNQVGDQGRSRFVEDPLFLGLSLPIEIFLLHRYGPVDRCERRTREIEEIYRADQSLNTSPWIWMYHARNAFARGELDSCERTINESLMRDINFIKYRQNSLGQLITVVLGKILFHRGELAQALVHFATVIPAGPVKYLEVLVGGHVDTALCEFGLGNGVRAIDLLNTARRIAFEENLPHLGVVAAATQVELEIKLEQPHKAAELAEAMQLNSLWELAKEPFGLPWIAVEALARALFCLQVQQGRSKEALETADALFSLSLQSGFKLGELTAMTMRARALSLLGQDAASNLELERALALSKVCRATQIFIGMGSEIAAQIRTIACEGVEPHSSWAVRVIQQWESAFRVRSSATNAFTPREIDVLCELTKDQTTKAIAKVLMLSPETVKHHLKAIFSKLGASTREDAVAEARRRSLMP